LCTEERKRASGEKKITSGEGKTFPNTVTNVNRALIRNAGPN